MGKFNVRVYGILINGDNNVLISDEREYGMEFSKFPGGGLEYGEGLGDGLKREFKEECGIDIDILRHIHTTDVFVKSAFNDSQVIGVYYLVKSTQHLDCRMGSRRFDFEDGKEPDQVFRWVPVSNLDIQDLTFEIDRMAWRVFVASSEGRPRM
ncbi:NUDIX domain-containing protein [Parapedobacter composti]|uniref:NUDIX domain-containing protein n=1 Tax=Parapedobacter composti TaxID=623281 RepID=A0A1I1KK85_9SPHI|nr:NUDIX domain-containing protein [Parapedobacter composti]SFC61286.1 NUDIX domain-containing protein [Parapedobacter composti]